MDAYKTIAGMAQAEYEEKKSRFIGQVAYVETEAQAVAFLDGVRAANPIARNCLVGSCTSGATPRRSLRQR